MISTGNLNTEESIFLNDEFFRLLKTFKEKEGFNLIVVEFNDIPLRDKLIRKIEEIKRCTGIIDFSDPSISSLTDFENLLAQQAKKNKILHLVNLSLLEDENLIFHFLEGINMHREKIASLAPVNVIFWMQEFLLKDFILKAPDFWAWHTYSLDFKVKKEKTGQIISPEQAEVAEIDNKKEQKRIRKILTYLSTKDITNLEEADNLLAEELETLIKG